MKSFTVTIQNNLPPDFCMKNRGLFLRRRHFLSEEVTEEKIGISLVFSFLLSMFGLVVGAIKSPRLFTGPILILTGLGIVLLLFLFFYGMFAWVEGEALKDIQKSILYAEDEEACYEAILEADYKPSYFPDALSFQPFLFAFHNLYGHKRKGNDSFVCKEIQRESFGYEINSDSWKTNFFITRIELTAEEPVLVIGEDETILYLPQKKYEKIMKNKGE